VEQHKCGVARLGVLADCHDDVCCASHATKCGHPQQQRISSGRSFAFVRGSDNAVFDFTFSLSKLVFRRDSMILCGGRGGGGAVATSETSLLASS
jgi:hypothetical protein